ncbi:hypothetical protein RTP6_7850 [Batrachochytrium dendrobatidis]
MDEHMVCSLPDRCMTILYQDPTPLAEFGRSRHMFSCGLILSKALLIGLVLIIISILKEYKTCVCSQSYHRRSSKSSTLYQAQFAQYLCQVFHSPSEFKARRQITSCVGEPDHLMTRNGEIVAIVEEKGNWALSISDIVNSYDTERTRASALDQLYHYMRLNHRQYGILSSYENTWFVYRNQGCAVCEEPQVHETLYVSEGISFLVH